METIGGIQNVTSDMCLFYCSHIKLARPGVNTVSTHEVLVTFPRWLFEKIQLVAFLCLSRDYRNKSDEILFIACLIFFVVGAAESSRMIARHYLLFEVISYAVHRRVFIRHLQIKWCYKSLYHDRANCTMKLHCQKAISLQHNPH